MHKRVIAATAACALFFGVPATALANHCVNIKRPADKDEPFTIKGQWVNVEDAWLFVSPGTNVEEKFGVPGIHLSGENGNYRGERGGDALLEDTPACGRNPAIVGCSEEG